MTWQPCDEAIWSQVWLKFIVGGGGGIVVVVALWWWHCGGGGGSAHVSLSPLTFGALRCRYGRVPVARVKTLPT